MNHLSASWAIAAMIAIPSGAYAMGPTLPVQIDPTTGAISTIVLNINNNSEITSLTVESQLFGVGGPINSTSTGDIVLRGLADALDPGLEDVRVVLVDDDFIAIDSPQRLSLPPGVYCEQLTSRARVIGYDSEVESREFLYFEVNGDSVRPISGAAYASRVLTLAPIVNARGELVMANAGTGEPTTDEELRAPAGAAVLILSGDTGRGSSDISERNEP